MEKLQLTGDSPRCWWCGKKIVEAPRRVEITFGKKQYETLVCSPEHEKEVVGAYNYVKKVFPVFWIGIVTGLLLVIFGRDSALSLIGLLVLGVTLFICPFATPQTIEIIGLKKSFRIGRIAGAVLSIGALVILAIRFLR